MKKKLYQLHRRLSIIIAIPVLLWASSGFMHPLMTNIRPAIATQGWPSLAIDSSRLRISLAEALRKHHLDSFSTMRLVHIDTNWFYQVQPVTRRSGAITSPAIQPAEPVYLSCANGNVLPAGDWLYAQYLARYFLEGKVMGGAKVSNVSLLTAFDNEYKSINRLLPVYRVSFDRPDGIRIYVETTQDRFSFAMDNKRAVFDQIFRLFHTWGWLDFLGKGRLAVEMTIALLAFLTTVMGIYIFFSTRSKAVPRNGLVRARRNHRYTAIIASFFTLLWTFSGSYHAFSKFTDDVRDRYAVNDHFAAEIGVPDLTRMRAIVSRPVTNLSIVKIKGQSYWRVNMLPENSAGHKDLMKDGKVSLPPVVYVSTSDYSILPNGDAQYADWLATQFSGQPEEAILSTTPITSFSDEYNFTDKRLPVWKVSYASGHHLRLFVETSTGKLASRVDDRVMAEGYSFAVFHKHHFMDWGGKSVRDVSTMFWALAQVAMVVIGLLLYIRYQKRIMRKKVY